MCGVTIGRAAWESCSAMCNLGTTSTFVLGPRKTTENLDRVGRSQDLPDASWLLASNPALNTSTWALTLVSTCVFFLSFLFFENIYKLFLQKLYLLVARFTIHRVIVQTDCIENIAPNNFSIVMCGACQILSVIVIFVREFHSQKSQHAQNLFVTGERYWALTYMPLYTFIQHFLNVLVQMANKFGLQESHKVRKVD
jgi:hypothetical protein